MKKLLSLVAMLASAAAGPFAFAGADPAAGSTEPAPAAVEVVEKQANYYPLQLGATWRSRFTFDGRTCEVVTRIAKIEKIDGVELARLEASVSDAPSPASTEHLRATPEGVFRQRYNGLEVEPPLCLLKYPIREGETWKADFKAGSEEVKGTCRVLPAEEVTVPAGTFTAARVLLEINDGRMTIKTTYWFAPDLGIVKQTVDIGGRSGVLELQEYESSR